MVVLSKMKNWPKIQHEMVVLSALLFFFFFFLLHFFGILLQSKCNFKVHSSQPLEVVGSKF